MDSEDVKNFNPGLGAMHAKLGEHWTDFMTHFPVFKQTLFAPPTDVVASIMNNAYSFMGDFKLDRLEIAWDDWAAQKPMHISSDDFDIGIPS